MHKVPPVCRSHQPTATSVLLTSIAQTLPRNPWKWMMLCCLSVHVRCVPKRGSLTRRTIRVFKCQPTAYEPTKEMIYGFSYVSEFGSIVHNPPDVQLPTSPLQVLSFLSWLLTHTTARVGIMPVEITTSSIMVFDAESDMGEASSAMVCMWDASTLSRVLQVSAISHIDSVKDNSQRIGQATAYYRATGDAQILPSCLFWRGGYYQPTEGHF